MERLTCVYCGHGATDDNRALWQGGWIHHACFPWNLRWDAPWVVTMPLERWGLVWE